MEGKLKQLISDAESGIGLAIDSKELDKLKIEYIGKNGRLTALLKGLKDIPAQKRPVFGKLVNDARIKIEQFFSIKENQIKQREKQIRIQSETVDITLPGKKNKLGTMHPINIIKEQILDIFSGFGFKACDGPEIETDYYNFQALNIPVGHPARDMQDTFYITENILLRAHTSPTQVHVMEQEKPPIRILSYGKVYRSDDDATHSPMFHQIEGLAIDKKITLCDLKGLLDAFAKQMFSTKTKTRFRPSYFPFTEPSVEVDVSCAMCGGSGCRLCKGTGWIEILGAGMVNHRVLENCNIDTSRYSGFAFGLGIERITLIKYGIPDIRLLFENDTRFLKQFNKW
ncbi:MAG: phenylalanine--tRNA ligase subunit alpha [Clostridia bacterium]|nr:phenylalanine--tRNA ligase subunit alpha [Clostridia bacterium]